MHGYASHAAKPQVTAIDNSLDKKGGKKVGYDSTTLSHDNLKWIDNVAASQHP